MSRCRYTKELLDYLEYNPSTDGCLCWVVSPNKGIHIGDSAGYYDGYFRVKIKGKTYLSHKIIWGMFNGFIDQTGKEIDHVDGNTKNNTIENLRLVNRSINMRNVSRKSNNSTGITGVVRKIDNYKGSEYIRYIAIWTTINGLRKSKSFKVSNCEDTSKNQAILYREKMISELNREASGYTERHGK